MSKLSTAVALLVFVGLAVGISLSDSTAKFEQLQNSLQQGLHINDEYFRVSDTKELWKFFDELLEYRPAAQQKLKEQAIDPQPLAWNFIPYTQGRIMLGRPFSFTDPCFEAVTANIVEFNSVNCSISFTTTNKKSDGCSSFYNVNTREGGFFLELNRANHTVTVQKTLVEYEYDDINEHGWMVFYWPLGIAGSVESIINTVLLFLGPEMIPRNVDFFAHNMQWAMRERYAGFVNVSATEILSGTGLAVLRLDGLDPLTGWGTGAHTGHSTVALWFDDDDTKSHGVEDEDDLYIVESIGKEDYWPEWGWIKTPWYQWQAQAINADYHVALMRLSPEYQAKFDEIAARTWFEQWEGTPYGIQSFIFIFIDTALYNLPFPCTPDLFTVLATFTERIIPPELNLSVYTLLIQGYNQRLNSSCTTLQCVFEIIDPMKIDLIELTAWPEMDSYMYDGHPSLTCASFVTALYKSAGVFSAIDTEIQASEQSPKDLYQMAIWDPYWNLPAGCKQADPALPYCQFLGAYSLTLPGWNSIIPYKNMNQVCPSMSPLFYRPPIC